MIKTSPFGSSYEPYMGIPDEPGNIYCKCCGRLINEGEDCYWLDDSEVYCMDCEDEAYEEIAERHAHEYIERR